MSDELDIFKGDFLADFDPDFLKELMDETSKVAGGSGVKRISIRGQRFRLMSGGEQIGKANAGPLNIMVLKASDINRTYFEGAYDPEQPGRPTCWSTDGDTPSTDVPEDKRQATQCAKCPKNVKGSGQGQNSRACRFSQRLAIMLEGDLETIYQIQIPAASLFGAGSGSKMPLQAYVKFLKAHNMPMQAIMTEVRFDEDSESPKLFFKPARALTKAEIAAVKQMRDTEEANSAITLTVSQTDEQDQEFGIEDASEDEAPPPKPKAEPKPKPAAKKANPFEDNDDADGDEEDETPPPKVKKAKPEPKAEPVDTDKLAALADEWGDDEFDD